MKVKDFSKEIVKAAVNNAEGKTFSRSKVGLLAVITSSLSGPSIEIFGNPLYHLSGLLTYIPNRISDVYSTYQLAKLSEDPRFKEYAQAEQVAVDGSVDDGVWAVWQDDSGEILAIVYQGQVFTG